MSRNPFSKDPNPFADPSVTEHTAAEDEGGYDVPSAVGGAYGASGGSAWSAAPAQTPAYGGAYPKNGSSQARNEDDVQVASQPPVVPPSGPAASGAKNFPRCFPLVYHDIDAEVPANLQHIIRWTFWSYLLFCTTLVWNSFALLVSLGADADFLVPMFLALFYMVVGIPGAWILWYKRIYNASRNDRALTYMCFFMVYIVHIGFCIWGTIAPPWGIGGARAFAGAIRMSKMFDEGVFFGVVYLVAFLLWLSCSVVGVFLWSKLMTLFRTSGGVQQAQSEATRAAGRAAARV